MGTGDPERGQKLPFGRLLRSFLHLEIQILTHTLAHHRHWHPHCS